MLRVDPPVLHGLLGEQRLVNRRSVNRATQTYDSRDKPDETTVHHEPAKLFNLYSMNQRGEIGAGQDQSDESQVHGWVEDVGG